MDREQDGNDGMATTQQLTQPASARKAANEHHWKQYGIGTDQALAIAAIRRHAHERSSGKDAPACRFSGHRGRPTAKPSSAIWDARIIRKIDTDRCLLAIGAYAATILKLYYVNGESIALIAAACGKSIRTVQRDIPAALAALTKELDAANLL